MRKTVAQVNAEERQRSEEAFRSARKMILWFSLGILALFLFGCAAHPQPVLTHWNCVNSPPYSYVECLPLEVLK